METTYEVYISSNNSDSTLWEIISGTKNIIETLKDYIRNEGLEECTISDYILINASKAYVECDEHQTFTIKNKK